MVAGSLCAVFWLLPHQLLLLFTLKFDVPTGQAYGNCLSGLYLSLFNLVQRFFSEKKTSNGRYIAQWCCTEQKGITCV
jgi:hypothetical protein